MLLSSKKPGASVKLADFGLAVETEKKKHYYGECLFFKFLTQHEPIDFLKVMTRERERERERVEGILYNIIHVYTVH